MAAPGRSLGEFARGLPRLPGHLQAAWRCWREFRRPAEVLGCYLRKASPPHRRVELRNGFTAQLSDYPYDLVTFYLVFAKREYGDVPAGGVVVDIGANIGAYALYAAGRGAARVYAYEPAAEAYRVLARNVEANGLAGRVVPVRAAVTGRDGAQVLFPVRSDVANTVGTTGECEPVPTVSLDGILRNHGLAAIDLLKIDCEGGEYDIAAGASPAAWAAVRRVRLEYHLGRGEELITRLAPHGLRPVFTDRAGLACGRIWFERRN